MGIRCTLPLFIHGPDLQQVTYKPSWVRAHMCKPAGSGPAIMCHTGSFKHLCRLHVGVSENPLVIQIEWIELMATLRLQVLV